MWAFYVNLWAKGDHVMETSLPRVAAQSPLRSWPGFEPKRSGIPRPPKHKQFHCITVVFLDVASWILTLVRCVSFPSALAKDRSQADMSA